MAAVALLSGAYRSFLPERYQAGAPAAAFDPSVAWQVGPPLSALIWILDCAPGSVSACPRDRCLHRSRVGATWLGVQRHFHS